MKIKTVISEFKIQYNNFSFKGIYIIPFNEKILEPKLTIFFGNGKNQLRFPVDLVNRTLLESTNEDKLEFKNEFPISNIFLDKWECISIKLELTYCKKSEIILDSDSTSIDLDNRFYSLKLNGELVLKKLSKISYKIKNIITVLFKIILFIVSLFLIPLFLVESLLVAFKFQGFVSHGGKKYLNDEHSFKRFLRHLIWRISSFTYINFQDYLLGANKVALFKIPYKISNKLFFNKNQVLIISEYGNKLVWNSKFIYDGIKNDKNINTVVFSSEKRITSSGIKKMLKVFWVMGKSKVILTDSHFRPLNHINPSNNQYLIQVWHGCGVFKKVGYSKYGKEKSHSLNESFNRKYDYIFSTTKHVNKYHSEAFGVYESHIVPIGLPRTDIFFNQNYAEKVKNDFYEKYPQLKDKKILLYAPTIRFKDNGSYISKFNPEKIYNELNEEYAIILKLHIRTEHSYEIPEEYSDYIINIPKEDEINDLLFVADLLVTDYSSIVFEASLLNLPMVLYTYDLEEYIVENGLYYEFDDFAPGKIVYNEKELVNAIKQKEFNEEKIEPFKKYFFDDLDGNSTKRAIELIKKCLKN